MSYKGYDFFTALPDTVDEMVCKVCGEVCDVERSVSGPMSFGGAMMNKKTIHDSFSCSDSDEDWHEQALEIFRDIQGCHSPSLKKIMEKDWNTIVEKKKVMV